MSYQDLGHYISVLEKEGKLVRVKREINKDKELMPLVRWQFRGLPEEKRKGFLFENVTNGKGRVFGIPVAVATHAASRELYALAMECKPEQIYENWARVLSHPIDPVMVDKAPVQEEVHMGDDLEQHRGLEEFPIPISTPGYDPAPFLTAGCWVSKDPESGIRNLGTYRAHVKGLTRTGIQLAQHIGIHLAKARAQRCPLEVAIVIGGPPSVALVSTAKVPYEMDELAVAGAIGGEPLPLAKCKTVDLEVPAGAEIVLEGTLSSDSVEPEAPFGEYTGYMGYRIMSPILEIKCITHRKNPIYHAFISQFPPSESSKIRGIGREGSLYKFLKYECNIPGIMDVYIHEESGSGSWCVIRMKKTNYSHPWQALNCATGYSAAGFKVIVAVDEDIDPRDPDSVIWAISYGMQPHLDVRTVQGMLPGLDPSAGKPEQLQDESYLISSRGTSCLLIDATRKWAYPPVALPRQEIMEHSRKIWEELGLPELKPKRPWHGYSLGMWTQENEEEADLALKGEYLATGDKLATGRRQL